MLYHDEDSSLHPFLAGHRLKGRDVLKAGVATHICDAARIGELEESLLSLQSPYPEDIAAVLDKFHEVTVSCSWVFVTPCLLIKPWHMDCLTR